MKPIASTNKEFHSRHICAGQTDTLQMLEATGASSLESLIAETIPDNIRLTKPMQLPQPVSEFHLLKELGLIASQNQVFRSFIGMGYYDTIVPGVIQRNILENPGWYTQYTPYQAEIAQGRLEALLNFQTMVMDLTGMEIANASLLDEATAAAEAMFMLFSLKEKHQGNHFWVSNRVFPQTLALLETRAEPLGIVVEVGDVADFAPNHQYFGALIQYPDAWGNVLDIRPWMEQAKSASVKIAVCADLMALTSLEAPGHWGADVVVGVTQRFGVPMGYGGPHAAFFATKDAYKRNMPGRLIGVSIDAQQNRALRMTLQTREQHIKRDKATSNICTAQVLLAIMSSMYAVYHGPKGLKAIADRVHGYAVWLEAALKQMGYVQKNALYFDTLAVEMSAADIQKLRILAEEKGINLNYFYEGQVGISLDEKFDEEDLNNLCDLFGTVAGKHVNPHQIDLNELNDSFGDLERHTSWLTHPVFNSYHSEHEMLRYIKKLESKDLSLTHSMIALGSCTMKLNATTEMIPVTWPEFGGLHPFAPLEQAKGYTQIFHELSEYLKEITCFEGVSLQPNAGAQGEYAGLMVIREFFKSLGQTHRDIALIPSSAHGTNPASAVMAGMRVVVVKCDDLGNIDVADLKAKADQYADQLAVLMVTYPSTHGVFEEAITEICAYIHSKGGQVYMDGANMNAQVGLTAPGMIGADVCHLNLHKTFCIPHGGGGPGMGPICVREHLVPFLPGHPVIKIGGNHAMSAISAAPWGSASILLISYVYIRLMGEEGLSNATRYAILNANYMKSKLEKAYPVLYTNKNGRVAHEMILDFRGFKMTTGVEVEDVAKRLMDFGFHAPTMSFPVPGTIMIEPTESEPKSEMDRFIQALLTIREEIREIEEGIADKQNNALKNAPHTASVVMSDQWEYPYSREKAAYPASWLRGFKFWPSVGRVNNTYGDRNVVCSCPPMEAYEQEIV